MNGEPFGDGAGFAVRENIDIGGEYPYRPEQSLTDAVSAARNRRYRAQGPLLSEVR